MNREQRRRAKKNGVATTEPIYAPVYMSPAKVALMKEDIIKRLEKEHPIDETLRNEIWHQGYDAGCEDSQQHYLHMMFICIALALHDCYGFAAKRIMDVWHAADKYYGEFMDRQDAGEDLTDLERELNERLDKETGLKFDAF